MGLACGFGYFTASFLDISHPLVVATDTFALLSEIFASVPKVLSDPTPFLGLPTEQLGFLAAPLRCI